MNNVLAQKQPMRIITLTMNKKETHKKVFQDLNKHRKILALKEG